MKTLALLAFGLFGAGCLGLIGGGGYPQTTTTSDMAQAPTGNGGSGGSGGGTGGNGGGDMALAATGGGSDAGAVDGGTSTVTPGSVAYAGSCNIASNPSDCATGLECEMFAGGAEHKCTRACPTPGTDTVNCTAPSDGTCTPNKYCKLP